MKELTWAEYRLPECGILAGCISGSINGERIYYIQKLACGKYNLSERAHLFGTFKRLKNAKEVARLLAFG